MLSAHLLSRFEQPAIAALHGCHDLAAIVDRILETEAANHAIQMRLGASLDASRSVVSDPGTKPRTYHPYCFRTPLTEILTGPQHRSSLLPTEEFVRVTSYCGLGISLFFF